MSSVQQSFGPWAFPAQRFQFIEQQLYPGAYELHELGIGPFVRLEALGAVGGDMRDLGEVPHHLTDIAGQLVDGPCLRNK